MFISVYASGTNIQRLAKCSKKIDGVLYTAYSQLEKTEPGMVKRKFFCLEMTKLKAEIEKTYDLAIAPSWVKLNKDVDGNKAFFDGMFKSLFGNNPLQRGLNLTALAEETINGVMFLTSADKKGMAKLEKIAKIALPDIKIIVLNGDYTDNKESEELTKREIEKAKIEGKTGFLVIANTMGSRSYSVPAIQASVIAFDRGSVDATAQKISRPLTPATNADGKRMFDNSVTKEYGYIIDLSFDPNRAENIERIILEEAIQVQREGVDANSFESAMKYVLSSINVLKTNEYGYLNQVTEEEMFAVYGDNDAMLRVADISVDIQAAVESGMFDILLNVNKGSKPSKDKKAIVGEGTKNTTNGNKSNNTPALTDTETKQAQKTINDAIRALNMSATSVYYLADGGESYRECLEIIDNDEILDAEFVEFYGVTADNVIELLENNVLNEAILDVIVQNSKPKLVDFLF